MRIVIREHVHHLCAVCLCPSVLPGIGVIAFQPQTRLYCRLLCINFSGVQTLSQVADQHKLIIAVGYMLRSSPAVIAAKQLMAEVSQISGLKPLRVSDPYSLDMCLV